MCIAHSPLLPPIMRRSVQDRPPSASPAASSQPPGSMDTAVTALCRQHHGEAGWPVKKSCILAYRATWKPNMLHKLRSVSNTAGTAAHTWWWPSLPTQLEAVGAIVSHTLRLLHPLPAPLLCTQRPPTTSTLLLPPTKSTAQPCLLSAWCHHSAQPKPSPSACLHIHVVNS